MSERDGLKKHVTTHLAILSPLRRLPPEILFEIFQWTLRRRDPAQELPLCPWRPALVFRRWRACALSDGILWSHVYINNNVDPWRTPRISHLFPRPLPTLKTQLSRSADVPLYITFQWLNYGRGLRALDAVVFHSHRWKTADLSWGFNDHETCELLSRIKRNLPLPRDFRYGRERRQWSKCDLFAVAPRTHKVAPDLNLRCSKQSCPYCYT